jgi:hypothetical protein
MSCFLERTGIAETVEKAYRNVHRVYQTVLIKPIRSARTIVQSLTSAAKDDHSSGLDGVAVRILLALL